MSMVVLVCACPNLTETVLTSALSVISRVVEMCRSPCSSDMFDISKDLSSMVALYLWIIFLKVRYGVDIFICR